MKSLTTRIICLNATQKVLELQEQFYALNATYAKNSLIQEFKKKGFNYKENEHFTPNSEEVYSDYLPNDVNERAHDAMDVLEQLLGNKRVMTKKPIPAKYAGKFKPRRVNIQTIEQK